MRREHFTQQKKESGYLAPTMDFLDIATEKGFAGSDNPGYGGGDPNDNGDY